MGGKMVSIVKLADGDEEKARDIAMHVAAINPKYISQDEIPQVEKIEKMQFKQKSWLMILN